MAKSKYTPLSEYLPELESRYAVILDYLVRNHIEKKRRELLHTGDENSTVGRYIEEIVFFVNSIISSSNIFASLNKVGVSELWQELRKNDSAVVSFLMHITAQHRFTIGNDIDEMIEHLADAYSAYIVNEHGVKTGVLAIVDKQIEGMQLYKEELMQLFKENPWVVTIALLPFINTIE